MRYSLFLSILLLCGNAVSVMAQEVTPQATVNENTLMQEKLERTRELMKEAKDPTKKATQDSELHKHDEDLSSSGMKMVQSLGFLVALVFIGAWAYRKFILKEVALPVRQMKLIERLPLSPRASLFLAEVHGMKIVVGMTADSISMLPLDKKSDFTINLEKEYEENS